tara:strand:+ start:2356 stop:3165 length:810 start_codon:yes stop_codon:yes gene_type:complete
MATIQLGKIKQVWRGTYNNSTAYVVDDLVEYTDSGVTSSYICVANSTGNAPSTSGTAHASWNYVAKGIADPIPTQSGQAGKFLKTNGSALSFDEAGLWKKIAGGNGPSTSGNTVINIDNIFSDTYNIYKVIIAWAQDDWINCRYIKADGSVQSGNNYCWTGYYSKVNADNNGRYTNYNDTHAVYMYWDGADQVWSINEIIFVQPYDSSKRTGDMYQATCFNGAATIYHHVGSNQCQVAESHRGLQVYGQNSDSLSNTNFKYLVYGANFS